MTSRPSPSDREAESQRLLRTTAVTPRAARFLSLTFVAILAAVPIADLLAAAARSGTRAVPESSASPAGGFSFLRADALHRFEARIEQSSTTRRWTQQEAQLVLTRLLGSGNHDVVIGRDGWMYYRAGIEYVIGRTLEPPKVRGAFGASRRAGVSPALAIEEFDRECRRHGVRLIVLPIPDKASAEPDGLTRRGQIVRADNAGFPGFVDALRRRGIEVLDDQLPCCNGARTYLHHDTHWTPPYMTAVARALAARIGYEEPAGVRRYAVERHEVAALGDLAGLLALPAQRHSYAPELVTIERVLDAQTQRLWEPDPRGRVLLLGDSFTNIYSDGEGTDGLGWGTAAGFGAQVSRFIGEPVDVIAVNGSGATGTRRTLALRSAPFDGKKVVVWSFAARDLTTEVWESVPFDERSPDESSASPAAGQLVIDAVIVKTSTVPDPIRAPYSNCVGFVQLRVERVESGVYRDGMVLAVFRTMADRRLLAAAAYRPGDRLRLVLVPLRDAGQEVLSLPQSDNTGDYSRAPFFVLGATPLS